MLPLLQHPIQRQIIGLAMSILLIVIALVIVYAGLRTKASEIERVMENQDARQEIGVSIYQRLFSARASIIKLSITDNSRELDIVKRRLDSNIDTIREGLSVLQNGGVFKDQIATNLAEQNSMSLVATYRVPETRGYVLEVLELGPAIHNFEQQAELLYQLVSARIDLAGELNSEHQKRIDSLLKTIDAVLQRTQENAARILYDTHQKISRLTTESKNLQILYDDIRFGVVVFALALASYLLFITLTRVGKVIENRQQAEDQLQLLLDSTVEGIFGVDRDGITTFINPAASQMLGYPPEELIERDNHALIHHTKADGSDYPSSECHIYGVLRGGALKTVDTEVFWRKDGTPFPVEYSSNPIYRQGEIVGAVVSFRDISERKNAEKRIRTLLQAIEQSPVSVVMTDTHGNIEYVNRAFEEATGYTLKEVLGKNPRILKSDNTPRESFAELWSAIVSGKAWRGELQNRKKSGDLFWERAYIAPVVDDTGTTSHYLAVKEDITLQKQQEERILHQANYDSLTDLPNRFLTLDRLSQLIKEAQRHRFEAAVLFLDLDDFKKVNDSMSHEAGDKLLIQAAGRLKHAVRIDDTVSRLGGDEFIVLLGSLKSEGEALPIAEKILHAFKRPFLLDGREVIMTVSIGIAVYPSDGVTPAELLRNADTAMYQSKEQGRNTFNFFTHAMNQGVSRRLQLEEHLHGALERDEFDLFFQPILDIRTREIMAAETLLRWNSRQLGSVAPDEFIPILEQTGQIVPVGQFVIERALNISSFWYQNLQKRIKLAVNISPRQFRDPNLVGVIQQALTANNIPNRLLVLEITEGVLMSGHTYVKNALDRLDKMGITIAMDDFGTGYSSLSYLRSYPFRSLKIDRSFVHDITLDPADRELVNATIAMAQGLGISVTAEGVETEEQLDYLLRHGCDMAQGYLFSRPVPVAEMTRLLSHRFDKNTA